jgi:beta-glucosidase
VVLNTSGPAYMPWLNDVAGVFEAWYPGQQDGYGLSYTTFAYSNLRVQSSGHGATATVTVTNTGRTTGAEVAQLYLTDPAAAGEPPYQLKGFQKVTLAPGHSQRITLELTSQDLSYYQTATSSWAVAPGLYRVSIGSNERDLQVSAPFYSH